MLREPPPHGTYTPGWLTRLVLMLSQNTPLGRGKARKLMAACVRKLNADRLDTQLFGQNVRLHMRNNSSEIKALMKPAKYSRAEFDFCAQYLPEKSGVFVDIGANAGLFSLGVLGFMKTGILIAAEPQPRLFERLSVNLKHFGSDLVSRPDIHLHKNAIGPEEGELTLYVPDQLGQASARALQGGEHITVPVRPLLDILQASGAGHVDVIKVDVEGFEDEVLLPFLATAPKALWPTAIVLEHCHRDRWTRDCEGTLCQLGYRLVKKDRTNLMFAREGL